MKILMLLTLIQLISSGVGGLIYLELTNSPNAIYCLIPMCLAPFWLALDEYIEDKKLNKLKTKKNKSGEEEENES